jgi:hypothetical protein
MCGFCRSRQLGLVSKCEGDFQKHTVRLKLTQYHELRFFYQYNVPVSLIAIVIVAVQLAVRYFTRLDQKTVRYAQKTPRLEPG